GYGPGGDRGPGAAARTDSRPARVSFTRQGRPPEDTSVSRPLLLAVSCVLAGPGGGALFAQVVVPPRPPPPPPPRVPPPGIAPQAPPLPSPPPGRGVPSGTLRSGTGRTLSTAAGRVPDQPARPPATSETGIGPVTAGLGVGVLLVATGVIVGWVASRKRL